MRIEVYKIEIVLIFGLCCGADIASLSFLDFQWEIVSIFNASLKFIKCLLIISSSNTHKYRKELSFHTEQLPLGIGIHIIKAKVPSLGTWVLLTSNYELICNGAVDIGVDSPLPSSTDLDWTACFIGAVKKFKFLAI